MEGKLLDGDTTDNLENLHKVHLTALLHDLMKGESWRRHSPWRSTTRL